VSHDGGLRMQKDPITLDTTNLTINCTSLTGCRLLGTANMAIPNEVATIESVTITDDEAGTVTMDGIAVGNGILTVENEAQALVRADPAQANKGAGAAEAAMALLALQERFA